MDSYYVLVNYLVFDLVAFLVHIDPVILEPLFQRLDFLKQILYIIGWCYIEHGVVRVVLIEQRVFAFDLLFVA